MQTVSGALGTFSSGQGTNKQSRAEVELTCEVYIAMVFNTVLAFRIRPQWPFKVQNGLIVFTVPKSKQGRHSDSILVSLCFVQMPVLEKS